MTTTSPRPPRTRTIPPDRVAAAVPSVNTPARIRAIARQQVKELALAGLQRVPGLDRWVDRPRTQPLRSSSVRMLRWWQAPYGDAAKPASLEEIPWDYVEENQDTIPFLGLREYWYPAVESEQVRHNTSTPATLLGDNVVFFRDATGAVRALENRCPHRSALLSLGQVGVVEPGTITCRYHGMTFDGDGECIAYIADGPDSPACGKIRARSYPTEEHGGIVWIYMGDREPQPFLDAQPHARSVMAQKSLFVQHFDLPYSHLNMLDNATDLTHVGVLHRSCLLFAGQKPFGEIGYTESGDGGLHAFYKEPGGHPGQLNIDHIDWYLPNLVYHAPGDLGVGLDEGWLWFTPRDVGSFTVWMIMGRSASGGRLRQAVLSRLTGVFAGTQFNENLGVGTLASCLLGGDAPMQASQGRVARWDLDRLARGDRAMVRARRMVQEAHAVEVAERAAATGSRGPRRLRRPATDAAPAQP